jgi:hypothetical protein
MLTRVPGESVVNNGAVEMLEIVTEAPGDKLTIAEVNPLTLTEPPNPIAGKEVILKIPAEVTETKQPVEMLTKVPGVRLTTDPAPMLGKEVMAMVVPEIVRGTEARFDTVTLEAAPGAI